MSDKESNAESNMSSYSKDEQNHNVSKSQSSEPSSPPSPIDFSSSEHFHRDESREAGDGNIHEKEIDDNTEEMEKDNRYVSSPIHGENDDVDVESEGSLHLHNMMNMARHHLGMMRPEPVSSETTKLLRGILQGREQHLPAVPAPDAMTNGDSMPSMRDGQQLMRNASFDTDFDSFPCETPGDMSSDDSDQENQVGDRASPSSETEMGIKDEKMEEELGEDGTKAKRARVENIINHMHLSPYKTPSEASASEIRRQKRKQYTPQQHEMSREDEPSPKKHKTEKDVLQKQLTIMQAQLSQMHHRYMQLFDETNNMPTDLAELKKLSNGPLTEKYLNDKESFNSSKSGFAESADLDPSHFIKQASKLVHEQEIATKESSAQKFDTNKDLEKLAKVLKQEISNSVGSLVDSIVSKFAQSKKKKVPTATLR